MPALKTQYKNIFIDEDYSSKDLEENLAGKKGYSLFRLRDMDVPVPRFYVISGKVFSRFISDNVGPSLDGKITSEKIQKLIKEGSFSKHHEEDIRIGYSRISGFTSTWVAVRSSIILPESHQKLSFAGQLSTILNARGINDLLESIKSVYASAFTSEVATYLLSNGLTLSDIKIAIAVQKMIQSEVSGVAFTVDPITLNDDIMSIEAVFGLGEVIADGDITPDQYSVNKKDLKFEEKRIVPQKWMTVRKVQHVAGEDGKQKVDISPLWQNRQKLENRYIEELVKIGMQIEKKEDCPQDIEWVLEGGHLWVIQTKKAKNLRIKELDVDIRQDTDKLLRDSIEQINRVEEAKKKFVQDMETRNLELKKPKISEEEIKVPEKKSLREVLKKDILERPQEKLSPTIDEKLLITGIGASKGTFRGKIKIINDEKDLESGISDSTVIVLKDSIPHMEGKATLCGAIISDTGGLTSDLSIICREKEIPCVLGTHISSKVLKNDDEVLVDGEVGAIYGKGSFNKTVVELIQKEEKSTEDEEIIESKDTVEKVPEEKSENVVSKEGEKPKKARQGTATKVFLDLSYGLKSVKKSSELIELSDGLSHLRIEDVYTKIGRHPGAYIDEGRTKEFIKQCSEELAAICEFAKGDPIIIGIGSMTVGQYKELTKGPTFEKYDEKEINDSTNGLQRLLRRPKELSLAIKIIKRVRNVHGFRNVSIAIEFAGNPQNVIEFKKVVSAEGLRRSSTFKIFLVVDTPSIALIVDQYESSGIDGMIIDIKSLKKLMMADKYEDPSILKIIDQIKSQLDQGLAIVRYPGKSSIITKKVVESGFYGIAVTRKNLERARDQISKLERTALF
ncbi:MAG: PEP/pyruvate-binding domain-containing protein [bacterium]